MAKANWVVVDPSQGSGNKAVNVSSTSEHTGRNVRSSTLTITAANVEPVTVTVNQQGKTEYVQNSSDTVTANQEGQNVTIRGVSNSKKLTFSLGSGNLNVSLPSTYTAGGLSTNNGAEISGDPGATSEYNWSIIIAVPVNENIAELTRQIIVTDDGGNTDICVITQAAGSPYLRVDTNVVELSYQGTPVSFNVESNTNWTIS